MTINKGCITIGVVVYNTTRVFDAILVSFMIIKLYAKSEKKLINVVFGD